MNNNTNVRLIDWDTRFFGFNVARVDRPALTMPEVQSLLRWCVEHKVRCLYAFVDPANPETPANLEDAGFHLRDIKVTLSANPKAKPGPTGVIEAGVRQWQSADLPALKSIAGRVHLDSRFFSDPNFSREHCRLLYEAWIENSCRGYANEVLTGIVEGRAAGYITMHVDEKREGHIGLLGVDPAVQRRGLGYALVSGALDWFAGQGVKLAHVATQGRNIRAQRLYQKCGFASSEISLGYHRWFGL